jgi:hypothetical protein
MSRNAKLNICRTAVRPVVVCATENWRLRKLEGKMIISWERRILRRIFGPKKDDRIWKIRTNKELIELYNNPDIVAEVRSRKIAWLRHSIKTGQGQMVKKLFDGKSGGRRTGRPRLRWLDDVEAGWRTMGVKNGGS